MPVRSALIQLFGLTAAVATVLLFTAPSIAAAMPTVIRQPQPGLVPYTPAYTSAQVTRDFATIHRSSTPTTVQVIVDSPARVEALARYASATANPHSKDFHHFLTPSELNHRYGPTPSMVREATSRMVEAGWQVLSRTGLVVSARVPAANRNPGLPVSPDIWSISGFTRHGVIATPTIAAYPTATPIPRHAAAATVSRPAADVTPNFNLSGENFHEPPNVLQQTTESNGDVVSVMSWNPLVASSVPAGLPINLFVTVEDPQGNFLPIANVGNLSDSDGALVSYGTAAMPASSNTLWQLPLAAWKDIRPGDLLTLTVTLLNGTNLNASFPLPAFTGPATVLTPLDGQQLNSLSGIAEMPSHLGAIALFAIGAPPSLKDLALYLDQNTQDTTVPSVTFEYEDGATANEYGATGDSEESQLDLEAAAGSAPGAPILDFVYPENDSNDPLISYLTDLSQQSRAKIANLSYGFFGEDPATLTTLMNALTAEGITVLEASGDQGAWDGGNDPGPVGLSALEQIPSVLSVGGTDVAASATTDGSGNTVAITGSIISDAWGGDFLNGIPVAVAQAYTSQNAASSGGYSTETPIPVWQQGFLPAGAPGFGVPIISSLAGFPGMSGFLQGQNVIFGGTSLASPLTAGWLDDVEAALNLTTTGMGDVNPLIFQAAGSNPDLFNQALWGQDGVYAITDTAPGSWNPLTGLGMLNWGGFIQAYNQLVPTAKAALSLATPTVVEVGTTVSATAYVRGLVNPLYQFRYQSPRTGRWVFSGPFGPSPSFTFKAKVPGHYPVLVAVKGATGPSLTAHALVVATTRAPMISNLLVRVDPPSGVVASDRSVTLSARADDLGRHPEFQFWIEGGGRKLHLLRGWKPNSTLVINRLKPGRYVVLVEALDGVQIRAHAWAEAFHRLVVITVKQ